MSDGEVKIESVEGVNSCGIIKANQSNGKRSFLITVDDNGKIEVSPKEQMQNEMCKCEQNKCSIKTKKSSLMGKQRIRIALIEEDAGSSEEDHEEDENKCDMVSIDAQSFEATQDRFIKIYNKNLRGKPSFVVLEDVLVRKRIEDTLQDHCSGSTCHCHAQQQTSSCDIGAHTGSQTDEFLLQYALRSQMKGHNRGCQATDVNMERPNSSNTFSPSKRNLQLHLNNESETPSTTNPAPQVTISFVSPQQPATKHSHVNCCTSHCTCGNGNNCFQQLPNNYCCLPPTSSFVKPQQQQSNQQQHPGLSSPCKHNCHSSCCLLRPSLAQTSLGCGMPNHCCQHMLVMPETSIQQHCQSYPIANWPRQSFDQCVCNPRSTCNMTSCGLLQCASCPMQHQQQQLQQQLVCQDHSSSRNCCYLSPHSNDTTVLEPPPKSDRPKKIQIKETKKSDQSMKQETSTSQLTANPIASTLMPDTPSPNGKIEKKARHKAASSKLYMARFGRTCLILKPSVCPLPPRLPTKPISHTTTE